MFWSCSPVSVSCKHFCDLLQYCWYSEEIDRDMEFIMTVVKTIRSLRADYNLTKTRADCKMTHINYNLSYANVNLGISPTIHHCN